MFKRSRSVYRHSWLPHQMLLITKRVFPLWTTWLPPLKRSSQLTDLARIILHFRAADLWVDNAAILELCLANETEERRRNFFPISNSSLAQDLNQGPVLEIRRSSSWSVARHIVINISFALYNELTLRSHLGNVNKHLVK